MERYRKNQSWIEETKIIRDNSFLKLKAWFLIGLLLGGMCILSGCAIINLPFQVVKTALGVINGAAKVMRKVPAPPPGVF